MSKWDKLLMRIFIKGYPLVESEAMNNENA